MTLRQGQGNETHSFFDVQYNIPEHIFKERQIGWRDRGSSVVTTEVGEMLLDSNEYDAQHATAYRTAPTAENYSPNVIAQG